MTVMKITVFVSNLSNVLSLYDKIEVHRSETGESGVYFPITADSAASAYFVGTLTAPFTINGTTLKLKVDGGAEQTVTFASPNPVSVDMAVEEINEQITGVTASALGSKIKLTSDTQGTDSLLEITGGTSLAFIGFSVGVDNGEDAHVSLQAGVAVYEYDDKSGDSEYYWVTRYYNSATGDYSSFSDPQRGNVSSIIPPAYLILAKIDLANSDGSPLTDRKITIYNSFVSPNMQVSDIGVLGSTTEMVTDQVGHAECYLVKSSIVDVTIVGTGITRRITVPSTGSDFNLLDEVAAADDVFQVRTPTIVPAVRRTL